MLKAPDRAHVEPILDHLTAEWATCGQIGERAGMDHRRAANLLRCAVRLHLAEERQVRWGRSAMMTRPVYRRKP